MLNIVENYSIHLSLQLSTLQTLIGVASFRWLFAIVTIPWNVYFDAQEVIAEANISRQKNINFDEKQLEYAHKVAYWSVLVAIALHLLSAVGLYILALSGKC